MKIDFYTFTMGDVDDFDVYANLAINRWQQTEQGQWVMANAHSLTYHTHPDDRDWGHRVTIRGQISEPKLITEYFLRWPN